MFKAIAAKKRITIMDIVSTRMLMAHGFLKSIFEVFAQPSLPGGYGFHLRGQRLANRGFERIHSADRRRSGQAGGRKVLGRKAIVCLVGENIRDTPGVAAKVFNAIARHEYAA